MGFLIEVLFDGLPVVCRTRAIIDYHFPEDNKSGSLY